VLLYSVTASAQLGGLIHTTHAGLMMEIIMRPDDPNHERFDILYKGLQPINFDDAEVLFDMVLPTQ
jgi:hypothetical protein